MRESGPRFNTTHHLKCPILNKKRHHDKKQENVTHIQDKKQQKLCQDRDAKLNKDIKASIINVFGELKEFRRDKGRHDDDV